MSRILRCAGCVERIKSHHPHIGVIDFDTGAEIPYHARCRERAALETALRLEAGKVCVMHHCHSSACLDAHPGFGCAGGYFDAVAVEGAN